MSIFLSEFLGSMFLLFIGSSVVANVILNKTKGHGSGWLVITFGWAMAVFFGVSIAYHSGAHLNPAVTIAMAMKGNILWSAVMPYLLGQFAGCFVGATLGWVMYKDHFDATEDKDLKLAVFATGPAIPNTINNLISEILGTFTLISFILFLPQTKTDLGHLSPLPVALIVLSIGLSLGGTTGYAINPARDLAPRIAHAILPIHDKGSSNWAYSWIPVVGPIVGAALAVGLHNLIG
jgi:glycerol uptake facilitator protein